MARTCKFYKIKQLVSYDCGESWETTGRYDKGALYEVNSRDCGFMLIYRWALSAGDYDCDGVRKYNMEVLQFTTEQGGEYQNVSPEYKRRTGSVVDWLSTDCGYVESTGGFKFSGTSVVNCGTKPSGSAYTESTLYRQEVSAITAPHSVVGDCTEVIGASAFSDSVLETIDISSYTKEIQSYAFADCSGITSMVIPDTVEKVGVGLFKGCGNLTGATLPSGIDYIPDETFYNCESITTYTVPNNVRMIGKDAFGSNGGQDIVLTIPSGVTDIEEMGAVNLVSGLTLPTGLKRFGGVYSGACDGCITLPQGIEQVGISSALAPQAIPGTVKSAPSDLPSGITLSEGTEMITGGYYGSYRNEIEVIPSTVNVLAGNGGRTGEMFRTGKCTIPANVQTMSSQYLKDELVDGFDVVINCSTPPLIYLTNDGYYTNDPESAVTPDRCFIFVPDESVELYKLMWRNYSAKIRPISWRVTEWRDVSISEDYVCVGVDKHYAQELYISKNSGTTWAQTFITRAGDLYEANSYDCGYRTRVISGTPYCVGYDKHAPTSSQTSSDYGETWTTTSTAETLVEHNSVDCGYIPSNITSVVTYNNGRNASITDCSTSTVPTYSGKTIVDTIVIGDCARTIPTKAFYECTSARSLTMVDGVTSIGVNAFYGCEGLTGSVTIPDSVTNLGDYSFRKCSGITSVSIGSGVTSVGKTVFSECRNMTGITIPSSITSIGDTAFWLCVGLADINLPDSVTSIGQSCFASCTSLTSVTIGTGITSIGEEAFADCSGLTSVTITATSVPTLGEYAFDNTNNCPIYVPAGSVNTYKTASGWSEYASRIQAIS